MQSIVKLQFIILILFSLSLSQDCDDNMLMYDCVGTPFCNNEATFGYDCYVNNQYCEDFMVMVLLILGLVMVGVMTASGVIIFSVKILVMIVVIVAILIQMIMGIVIIY